MKKATAPAKAEPGNTPNHATHDVAKLDEIRDLGFRTDKVKSGYVAHEILGDRRVPESGEGFKYLNDLVAAVKAEVDKTGIAATALQQEPNGGGPKNPDTIITEELAAGTWTAYRKGNPEMRGAGLDEDDAIEDLEIAEAEAAFAGRSTDSHPTRLDFNSDEAKVEGVTEQIDEIEETAASDDEAFNKIEAVIDGANQDEDESSPTIEVLEDVGGQARLPGQQRVVNPELTEAALKYHSIKMERVRLTGEEKASKDELRIATIRHADMFVPDPDNDDSKIYNAGQLPNGKIIIVRDKKVFEEAITTEEVAAMPKADKKARKPKK